MSAESTFRDSRSSAVHGASSHRRTLPGAGTSCVTVGVIAVAAPRHRWLLRPTVRARSRSGPLQRHPPLATRDLTVGAGGGTGDHRHLEDAMPGMRQSLRRRRARERRCAARKATVRYHMLNFKRRVAVARLPTAPGPRCSVWRAENRRVPSSTACCSRTTAGRGRQHRPHQRGLWRSWPARLVPTIRRSAARATGAQGAGCRAGRSSR